MIWDDAKIVAADLETSGKITHEQDGEPTSAYALQPWRLARGDAWITSASVLRHDPQLGMVKHLSQLFPKKEQIKAVLVEALEKGWTILGWNVAFDVGMLMALGPDIEDLCMRINWLDGMLLERHYDIEPEYEFQTARHKKKSYALKGTAERPGAMQRWLPHVPLHNDGVKFHSTDPADLARLQTYNDGDNVYTWVIAKMIWQKLSVRQRTAAVIEAEAIPLVAQANLHGMVVDRLTVKHLSAKLDLDAAARLHELAPDGMTEIIVRSPAKLGNLLFNPTSLTPEQVAEGMTPGWQLPVLKTNKSKNPDKPDTRSTDKEVLHELAFVDPRVAKVKQYREALNAKGKFCTSVLEAIEYNETGNVHPIANIFSTYTGRMTVSSKQGRGKNAVPIGFALHQMKREAEFREIINAPEGYDLVEFDAAGQEFRWMAIASGDTTMLNLCLPGEDPHSFMGAQIVGMDYRDLIAKVHAEDKAAGQNRYLGKFSNLSLQYRTSARKLRSKARVDYSIPLEMPEARRIHATYQRAYPGVPIYWERQIAIVKACGYVETFGGNRITVPGDWNGKWGWSMGSTAINARIQGTGADQKHLAMAIIKDYLRQISGRFLFDLHDGLYLLIPTAIREKAVNEMKRMLDNLPYQQAWGYTPPIPMPWDCKVGKAWGRMKEVKFA
jgi:DNA polymerase I-like protein with 3'-5' exonuclease and polymerase domains